MRAFEKCQRLLDKEGSVFCELNTGECFWLGHSCPGCQEVWGAELIYAGHWAVLCPFVLGKPCLSIQWRDHAIYLGTPGSNEAVAGSSVVLQIRDRTEGVAEGQHWWLVHSALWIMVPREMCPSSTF